MSMRDLINIVESNMVLRMRPVKGNDKIYRRLNVLTSAGIEAEVGATAETDIIIDAAHKEEALGLLQDNGYVLG